MRLPKPSEQDLAQALVELWGLPWVELMARARQVQARRLLHANATRQRELCDELDRCTSGDFERMREELERLFRDHDKLLDRAYPIEKAES